MGPLYFGCWDGVGHYLWNPGGRRIHPSLHELFGSLDGKFCPTKDREGDACLTHTSDKTILAFWDRSVDSRPGSNSVFVLPGHLTFDQAVHEAKMVFPGIWNRFSFNVSPIEERNREDL